VDRGNEAAWHSRHKVNVAEHQMQPRTALRAIKIIHTLVWAIFAACIIAVPIFTHARRPEISAALIAITSVEVLVVVLNHWRCPLTGVAASYTTDRSENFDIYLPAWLAKYNKVVFGALFIAGTLYTLFALLSGRSAT
jgi:hypothetical protein